jgi:hypothetical protein
MIRVISSPSSSTTVPSTLIFDNAYSLAFGRENGHGQLTVSPRSISTSREFGASFDPTSHP